MNVSSDTILEIFKSVAVDYNYTVSVSDLRNYISSHNWKFKLTKKTDSGKLYDLEFQFVKGLTEDLFWDLSHIYPDDFGKFYSGDYPEYDLGDEYKTEYDNWCYFLDDLQNEMRKVKYSSKELEEFETVSDSKHLKHKNMKRIKDNVLDEPVLLDETSTESLYATDLHIKEVVDNDYVWGDINIVQEVYDFVDDEDSYEPVDEDTWQQGFTLDLTNNTIKFDGGTYFSEKAKQSIIDLILENVGNASISDSRRHVKDGVYDDSGVDGYNKFPAYRVFPSKSKIAFDNKDEAIEYAKKISNRSGANNTYGKSRRSFLDDVHVKEYTQNNKNGVVVWSNNGISDSRVSKRSIVSRIKDSVKAKNIRQRITDAAEKYFKKDLKNLQAYRRVTDSEGKVKENVVFLIEDSDVLAVFPNTYGTASRDCDTMVCYSHNGQHGVCTYDYANTLKTADSYDALKDELTNYVGYNLTIVDSLPSETELKQNAREIRDAYKQHKRHAITDERLLARGEEIQYNGKRGTVQYALFHGQEPVVIRWTNEDGSEEFEIPYNQVGDLKIHDSEDDTDANVEPVDNDSDIDDAEVTDNCGGKKKTKKKTADGVKRVKITKRQTKKTE